ncbi:MAG: MBL fold metallo-hydrolase, partial [Candidatus Latescibacterota bacterium]
MHPFEDLPIPDGAIGIHWFGQNSYALKDSSGTILQLDPYFPHERPPDNFLHPRPPLHEASLRTDFVLLTHDHGDHTCVESLARLRAAYPEARYVGPVESVRRLRDAGFPAGCTVVIAAGDRLSLGSMTVHALWSKPPEGIPADKIA